MKTKWTNGLILYVILQRVYWCKGGTNCHSHEITAIKPQWFYHWTKSSPKTCAFTLQATFSLHVASGWRWGR